MKKNNCIKAFILCSVVVLMLSGCGKSAPETLYQSESVQVIRNGSNTTVLDLVSDSEYNYTTKRVKRTEGVTEPYTSIDTNTVKVEIIPNGMRVYDKTEWKVLTVNQKSLRKRGCKY